MSTEALSKVNASHLRRNAYLYVRQSTVRQVLENTESTQRQYALRQRAVALGWPIERVIVIDTDLGQSGASSVDRAGFQKLVAEVGMGRAGIVMGLEVSRLARNSTDWHRLLEICALSETLILDEDGVYDPAHFNDRLLLGLKGTMSEAELHMLRALARWPAQQGATRRVALPPADRFCLRRRRARGPRSRQSSARDRAALLFHFRPNRRGERHRQTFSTAALALPNPDSRRRKKG